MAGSSAQNEEDEKRPYKFAFNIEGYQHRSEEKDEKGIIHGEYGFVTGDGVYHVTVYATDENGAFKILSMKNYYVGLPGQGTTTARETVSPQPRVTSPPTTTTSTSTTVSPIIQHLNGLMGCSGCIIPEKSTTKPNEVVSSPPQVGNENDIDVRVDDSVQPPNTSSGFSEDPLSLDKPNAIDKSYMGVQYVRYNEAEVSSTTPCSDCGITAALRSSSGVSGKNPPTQINTPSRTKEFGKQPKIPAQNDLAKPSTGKFDQPPSSDVIGGSDIIFPSDEGQSITERPNYQFSDNEAPYPARPNLSSQQPQVPGQSGFQQPSTGQLGQPPTSVSSGGFSTSQGQTTLADVPELFHEIYSARPSQSLDGNEGVSNQSPSPGPLTPTQYADPAIVAQDLFDKFYQFHHILRYNGHNETGYRNGNKEGEYFVNGRDGVKRNVQYVANEFGYQPNITFISLGLESPDTPKELNEESNDLISSEFRWFYRR